MGGMPDPYFSRNISAPRRSRASKWTRLCAQHHAKACHGAPVYSCHRLSATDTNIFGFNANSTRPIGKIKLRCQIGHLKTEVTVYVIDADTSYNLLLGRPWIHKNHIVPSTLHQVMKYVDAQGQVRTLVAEQRPIKRVKNYFTDALLYQEAHEVVVQDKEVLELGNKADREPASES